MFNETDFLKEIKQKVLLHDPHASVILFGSRARGDYRPDSDWDVLVLTDENADAAFQRKLTNAIYKIELEYEQDISTLIRGRSQWEDVQITSFYKNVMREGIAV